MQATNTDKNDRCRLKPSAGQAHRRDEGGPGVLELTYQPDHFVLLLGGDFREHRQRYDPALVGERVRELLGTVPEAHGVQLP